MARPSSDIDPKHMEVEPRPKCRRRKRAKADPKPFLKAGEKSARARAERRTASPGVMLEPTQDRQWQVTSPHSDLDLWELQIADAFGTRSLSVMRTFMRDLKRLCSQAYDQDVEQWKPDETELNAALAMVADIKPRNTAEAALAAQMVAIHLMTMRLSSQALNRGGMVMEKDAALAGKLARTFTMQMEALQSLRGKRRTTRQSITVKKELHQHVHYHRGDRENGAQPHATDAGEPRQCAALPGPDQGGQVVPLRSRKGSKDL